MDTNEHEYLDGLVKSVIGAAYRVSNALGCGFLEKVYERALSVELGRRGLRVQAQVPFPIFYCGYNVGDYCADIVVEGKIIVELKCVESFSSEHFAQCINYLRA